MVKLPQFQEQLISTRVSDPTAGDVGEIVSSAGKLIVQTGDILRQKKLARDMTRVSELSTDFELELQDDLEAFKRERGGNVENFSKDFDEFVRKKKKEFVKESDLGPQGGQAFSKIAENVRGNIGTRANKYESEQEIKNLATSIERTTEKNNLLSFRAGQDLDVDALSNIEASVDANVLAGASFLPADKLDKMKVTQTQGAYIDFIKGTASTDTEFAKQLVENKDIQNKLVDVKTADMLRSYIRQVENRKKQLENNSLAEEKSLKKAALDVDKQVQLESEFNKFNISTAKDTVGNKKFNSMTDIITFRDDVQKAYGLNKIPDAQFAKYMSDTAPVMIKMLQKGKGETRQVFPLFLNTVNEQVAKDIKKQFKENEVISDSDLAGIYEETYKQLLDENIEPTSINNKDKLRAQELLKQNIQTFSALVTGRNDTNATIVGNSIVPLNDQAEIRGTALDNGGYKLEQDANGNRAYVRRDSNGNVLDIREVR
jgi:hypothetical protein